MATPHPDDGKYARVYISDDYYLGSVFEYPIPKGWERYGNLYEVPVEWVERWQKIKSDYYDMQEELTRILRLPAGQNRIERIPD